MGTSLSLSHAKTRLSTTRPSNVLNLRKPLGGFSPNLARRWGSTPIWLAFTHLILTKSDGSSDEASILAVELLRIEFLGVVACYLRPFVENLVDTSQSASQMMYKPSSECEVPISLPAQFTRISKSSLYRMTFVDQASKELAQTVLGKNTFGGLTVLHAPQNEYVCSNLAGGTFTDGLFLPVYALSTGQVEMLQIPFKPSRLCGSETFLQLRLRFRAHAS
jgi:hypothetical protein